MVIFDMETSTEKIHPVLYARESGNLKKWGSSRGNDAHPIIERYLNPSTRY